MHFRTIKKTFKENHEKELKYLEDNYYIDVSEYDLVIGYRADDSYFEFPLLFVDNKLRLETLTEIYELGHLVIFEYDSTNDDINSYKELNEIGFKNIFVINDLYIKRINIKTSIHEISASIYTTLMKRAKQLAKSQ